MAAKGKRIMVFSAIATVELVVHAPVEILTMMSTWAALVELSGSQNKNKTNPKDTKVRRKTCWKEGKGYRSSKSIRDKDCD